MSETLTLEQALVRDIFREASKAVRPAVNPSPPPLTHGRGLVDLLRSKADVIGPSNVWPLPGIRGQLSRLSARQFDDPQELLSAIAAFVRSAGYSGSFLEAGDRIVRDMQLHNGPLPTNPFK